MEKLFTNSDTFTLNFNIDTLNMYFNNSVVISNEAISDYFYKLKDILFSIRNSIYNPNNDKIIDDILINRFEAEHIIKRLKLSEIKDNLVSIPENFKGKYVDYISDLIDSSKETINDTRISLDNLKLTISSFINEYSEDKVFSLYGINYFKQSKKVIEVNRKNIAKYFPVVNYSVKAHIGDVLKSLSDVKQIHDKILELDSIINYSAIKGISKTVNEVSDLVDVLIEQNIKSGILLKNNSIKKELTDSLYIVAKEVELVSYIYSNCIYFYNAIKNLNIELIRLGNR